MITFCKNSNCPSSQQLLAFERDDVAIEEFEKIKSHLSECEFCACEVEFYAHYPQSEETVAKVEIPIPLYELAEALLSNKHKDYLLLNKLLCENERVKI
jgi:hypothetical protein